MKKSDLLVLLFIAILIFSVTLVFIKIGVVKPWLRDNIVLAKIFITNIPDPSSPYTSRSPEIVTSVLWDHRGLDTYYETSVLFIAIVGSLYILSRVKSSVEKIANIKEYTVIARLTTKLVAVTIAVVSVSVALHGHLTPGGGFQGGVVFVIAPLMIILVFGGDKLVLQGFREKTLLSMRAIGVSMISIAGSIVLLIGLIYGCNAYLFQNQAKPMVSEIGYPYQLTLPWGTFLFSGSLMILNILEFLAVSAGFVLVLVLLDKSIGGEMD